MEKYHVALSFAGEDRDYVERTAAQLARIGVKVFYDKFEDTKLWGKDLYTHLSDVYQNQAMYTVMFISEAYKNKTWTNHERKNAQARAFSENREYILPAVFDKAVDVPGVLKTTGYIDLTGITPEEFAEKIAQKLRDNGVVFTVEIKYRYSETAKEDIDFPLSDDSEVTEIITALKSYNWYTQSPAIEQMFKLDWSRLSQDQIFVLGRNLYQCACGGERRAVNLIKDIRRTLARLPIERAIHFLNGMFYEVYFDAKGAFRNSKLKSRHIAELFSMQGVNKYEDSIAFIRQALEPYRSSLAIVPGATPETINVKVVIDKKDPPSITSVQCHDKELLIKLGETDPDTYSRAWRLSFRQFTLEEFAGMLAETWQLPRRQLVLQTTADVPKGIQLQLPEGITIARLPR